MKKIIDFISLLFRTKFIELVNKKSRLEDNKLKSNNKKNIYGFLDLSNFRSTYDIIGFLIYCKIQSYNKNFTLIIIKNKNKEITVNPSKEINFIGNESVDLRTDNIVKPCLELVEGFDFKLIIAERNEVNKYLSLDSEQKIPNFSSLDKIIDWDNYYIYINDYFKKNKTIPSLKSPKYAYKLVDLYKKKNNINKKIVTITLRDSSYAPLRNSNIENWKKVYKYLEDNDYYPIILDDNENFLVQNSKNNLSGFNQYYFANVDPRIRLALYEKSYFNFSVNHGPSQLLIYSKYCKFLIFKHYVNDETSPASLERIEKIVGLKKNEQYPFFNNKQKLVWNVNDDYELIIDEFKKIINN